MLAPSVEGYATHEFEPPLADDDDGDNPWANNATDDLAALIAAKPAPDVFSFGLLYMYDTYGDGWEGNEFVLIEQDAPRAGDERDDAAWFEPPPYEGAPRRSGAFAPPRGGVLPPGAPEVARGTLEDGYAGVADLTPSAPYDAALAEAGDASAASFAGLRPRASYYLSVGGGERSASYFSEVTWRFGDLEGGIPSLVCFTVLDNATFATWPCAADLETFLDATPPPTPAHCRRYSWRTGGGGDDGLSEEGRAWLIASCALGALGGCCVFCLIYRSQLESAYHGVYDKGSAYQRKFMAMKAARAARGAATVKLDYKVVIVGKKHCKYEPQYSVEKN